MARAKLKFKQHHGAEIMKSPKMQAEIQALVNNVTANLAEAPGTYESAVEDGGDRARGAVWTWDADAMRDTGKNGTLLSALGGS